MECVDIAVMELFYWMDTAFVAQMIKFTTMLQKAANVDQGQCRQQMAV